MLVFSTASSTFAISANETAWLLSLLRSVVLTGLELTAEWMLINGRFLLLCACVSAPVRRYRALLQHPVREWRPTWQSLACNG